VQQIYPVRGKDSIHFQRKNIGVGVNPSMNAILLDEFI